MPKSVVVLRRLEHGKLSLVGLNPEEEDHLYETVDLLVRDRGYTLESVLPINGQPFTLWMETEGRKPVASDVLFEWVFDECQNMDYVVHHD